MEAPMVQVVENHAEIDGQLIEIRPDPDRPGFVLLTVEVRGVGPVGAWPNLFERDVGKTIAIVARGDTSAARNSKGHQIKLRVKKVRPNLSFAE